MVFKHALTSCVWSAEAKCSKIPTTELILGIFWRLTWPVSVTLGSSPIALQNSLRPTLNTRAITVSGNLKMIRKQMLTTTHWKPWNGMVSWLLGQRLNKSVAFFRGWSARGSPYRSPLPIALFSIQISTCNLRGSMMIYLFYCTSTTCTQARKSLSFCHLFRYSNNS